LPNAPLANNVTVCYDGAAHAGSAAVGAGETIAWYTAATGGAATVAPSRSNMGTTVAYAAARNTATGCESVARTLVSVTILSQPIKASITAGGPLTFCENESVLLTATGNATSYRWYHNGSFTGVVGNPYEATQSGDYSVVVVSHDGCLSEQSTAVRVTVNPLPSTPAFSLSDDRFLCPDETVILIAEAEGAVSYIWRRDGEVAQVGFSVFLETDQPGTYTVEVISHAGCHSAESSEQVVTAVPLPEPPIIDGRSPLYSLRGASLTLTVLNVANGLSYQWYKNDAAIAGASETIYTIPSLSLSDAAVYFVRAYTLPGHCANDSRPVTLVVLEEVTVSNIVTPNGDEWNDFLRIDGLEAYASYEIKIVNRYGNEVFRTTEYHNDPLLGWKGDNLPDGVYFYRIDLVEHGGANVQKTGYVALKHE
jgi:gliding motility-associated-like protein